MVEQIYNRTFRFFILDTGSCHRERGRDHPRHGIQPWVNPDIDPDQNTTNVPLGSDTTASGTV